MTDNINTIDKNLYDMTKSYEKEVERNNLLDKVNNDLKLKVDLLNENVEDYKTKLININNKYDNLTSKLSTSTDYIKWYKRILQTFRETLLSKDSDLDEQISKLVNCEEAAIATTKINCISSKNEVTKIITQEELIESGEK